MSPINPGERWPQVTRTQQAATFVRTNSTVVAFLAGELAGIVTVAIALILTKVS